MPMNVWIEFQKSLIGYRGSFVAALFIVGGITAVCVLGVILLSALRAPIPNELGTCAVAGMGFLAGSVTTAAGRKPPDGPQGGA